MNAKLLAELNQRGGNAADGTASPPPPPRPTPSTAAHFAKTIEKLCTEDELDADRTAILAALLDSFTNGARLFAIRLAIDMKHGRVLCDESADPSNVFDREKLIRQLKAKCCEHEVAANVPVAERHAASDAALEYPQEVGLVLSQILTGGGITASARSRVVQKLERDGVQRAHIDRFHEILELMAPPRATAPPAPPLPAPPPAPPAPPPPLAPPGKEATETSRPLPFRVLDDGIELAEAEGNAFHLCVILRKYTSAKLAVKAGSRLTKVENPLLWDALGLLRSLRYDVNAFNSAAAVAPGGAARSREEVRYLCYRLMRQASSFGVRLPKPGEATVGVHGLDELIEHVETRLFPEELAVARSTVRGGLVDFCSLAELFTPGTDLVDHGAATGLFGVPLACRVRACYYSKGKSLFGVVTTFYAACEFVVSVGDRFAVIESHQILPEFQGTRPTAEGLEHFITLSPELKARLQRRGERYCAVATGHAYVEHGPGAFLPAPRRSAGLGSHALGNSSSALSKARSAGRMMVDVNAAWERGVHCARTGGEACEAVAGTLKLVAQRQRASGGIMSLEYYGAGAGGGGGSAGDESSLELLLLAELPPSLLWLTWPVVAGFSFAAKSWGVALVDGLREATFNDKAFEQLVLPPSRKRLIEALVLSHADAGRETADVIAGKGEGSIFLLHGPPGVGKTLTAEAIAELLHKPLYTVSMGELGTSPESLESNLQDILDLCVPWGALVLIDEAEMLLERRTKSDIVRNAMVCVMLRLLEYYTGVLFLTSNRVESLDPAFQSRVQCALRYDALDVPSRRQVWINLLAARGYDGESNASIDVDALASHRLNGRQIKNCLQLALALARRDGTPLAQSHLDSTLELSTAFAEAVGIRGLSTVAGGSGFDEAHTKDAAA